MPYQHTVFRQLSNHLPFAALQRLIDQHDADKGVRRLSSKQLLLTLLLAQVHESSSLRDIEPVLESQEARLYYSGLAPACFRGRLRSATVASSICLFNELRTTHTVYAMAPDSHDQRSM